MHESFLYKGEKLRSMPASAAAKYSRMLDIYTRMLVTDICSIVYKFLAFTKSRLRSWSNICVFSFGAFSCLVAPFDYLFVS